MSTDLSPPVDNGSAPVGLTVLLREIMRLRARNARRTRQLREQRRRAAYWKRRALAAEWGLRQHLTGDRKRSTVTL